ncbi:WhiB family transcriptional regulator [Streptomyces sp. NPDC004546]|uniref:WhiB family transcriptional regulator n=1 Tax=Streptomyces sp. NPDC004546 TaxID=3154282 RepID=UPI0033A1DAD9
MVHGCGACGGRPGGAGPELAAERGPWGRCVSGQHHVFGGPLVALGIPPFVWEARERLRCRDDPDAFFAEGIRPRQARALCAECGYLEACGAYALERAELVGVWGGTTTGERRALRRRSAEGLAAAS